MWCINAWAIDLNQSYQINRKYYNIVVIAIINMSTLFKTILNKLKDTSLNHKKKLIALIILIVGGTIAKKKLKLNHIISLTMFCFRIFSKVLGYLPLPTFSNYRPVLPFKYQPQSFHPLLAKVMQVEKIMIKIKVQIIHNIEQRIKWFRWIKDFCTLRYYSFYGAV